MPTMRSSPPARPRSCSTSLRSRPPTSAAARPVPAKRICCGRTKRSSASTRSCSRAARPSASMPPAARRPGCASRAAALRSAPCVVPIVPGAIVFDLINGGDKDWGRFPPYRDLGYAAAANAGARLRARHRRAPDYGANDGQSQGRAWVGLGRRRAMAQRSARSSPSTRSGASPSANGRISGQRPSSTTANSADGASPRRSRADALSDPRQGRRRARTPPSRWSRPTRRSPRRRRTALRSSRMMGSRARSIPCTPRSTATSCSPPRPASAPLADPVYAFTELGALAANVLARAVARGVYEATALPFPGALPAWKGKFGS